MPLSYLKINFERITYFFLKIWLYDVWRVFTSFSKPESAIVQNLISTESYKHQSNCSFLTLCSACLESNSASKPQILNLKGPHPADRDATSGDGTLPSRWPGTSYGMPSPRRSTARGRSSPSGCKEPTGIRSRTIAGTFLFHVWRWRDEVNLLFSGSQFPLSEPAPRVRVGGRERHVRKRQQSNLKSSAWMYLKVYISHVSGLRDSR